MFFWPLAAGMVLLLFRTTAARAPTDKDEEPTKKRRRRRKPKLKRKRKRKRKRRRKKKAPTTKLPDPIEDMFGPKTTIRKKRRRAPPKPTPKRKRRRRRKPTPTSPKTKAKLPASKPAPRVQQPNYAQEFVKDLRAGELDRNGVAEAQRKMGELDPDGIGGDKTKGRTETLLKRSVDWSDITWPRTPSIPTPPNAKTAARELVDYVHIYGGKRRPRIRMYQRTMGMTSTPGRVGPATKSKVMDLIGVEL